MSNRRRILVTGATGYVGGRLLNALVERSSEVRCLARRPQELSPRPGLEVVGGDALDPGAVRHALEGIEVAFYLIHAMGAGLRRLLVRVPLLTPHETVVRDPRALERFSIRPRGFREAIARALANEDQELAETRWFVFRGMLDGIVQAG